MNKTKIFKSTKIGYLIYFVWICSGTQHFQFGSNPDVNGNLWIKIQRSENVVFASHTNLIFWWARDQRSLVDINTISNEYINSITYNTYYRNDA